MKEYFRYVNHTVSAYCPIEQLISGRFRGDISFTKRCNTLFQGLAADMAKDAGFRIAYACYVDLDSPLLGGRIVKCIHDEFILEVPEHRGHEAAHEVSRNMIEAARVWIPAVKIVAKPVLMRRWSKRAKQVWKDQRFIPWVEGQ